MDTPGGLDRWPSALPMLDVQQGDVITLRLADGTVDHMLVMDVQDSGTGPTWSVLSGNQFDEGAD